MLKRAINRLLRILPSAEVLDGYDDPEVVETVFRKSLAYVPTEPLEEVAGKSRVLDFGGGCGLHYKQALLINPNIRWAIVENPRMVAMSSDLATSKLRFFSSVDRAHDWLGSVDLLYSNGALQYCRDPGETLAGLCGLGARELVWKRLLFSRGQEVERNDQFLGLSHSGPGISISRKVVRYKRTLIPESAFLAAHANYRLIERGTGYFRFALSKTLPR